jgi:hypothetical protein
MVPATFEKGLHSRVGYTGADLAIRLFNSFRGDFTFYFLSMGRADLVRYVETFMLDAAEPLDLRLREQNAR